MMKDETSSIIHRNDGTSIIFAVFALIVLSILGLTIFSLVSTDIDSATSQILSSRALFAAESGWQIGAQAVKDDKDAAPQDDRKDNGYCGTVFFDGYQADGDNGSTYTRACFYRENPMIGKTKDDNAYAILSPDPPPDETYVEVWDFQQRLNMIGTRIKSARLGIRARRSRGNKPDPVVQLQYITDGGTGWANLGSTIKLKKDKWPKKPVYYDFTTPPTWQDIMDVNNFRIRALRTNSGGGREAHIDWLGLELTLECDTLTEPWGSGSFITTLPASLGNAEIQSITISDESSKVHLNYASALLLEKLMDELSITNSVNKASAIVSYRNSVGWFNTIEEINQISTPVALDNGDFETIKGYITVYPWVNNQVTRPTGARAPINVNTAKEIVLRAVFMTIDPSIASIADKLARDIIKDRTKDPFTHMNSSKDYNDKNLQAFAYYVDKKLKNEDAINAVRENADASHYNKELTSSWTGTNSTGTEFCYNSHTFLIESTGRSGNIDNIERTVIQTYGDTYSDNNFNNGISYIFDLEEVLNLPTYLGEPEADRIPYWREEH